MVEGILEIVKYMLILTILISSIISMRFYVKMSSEKSKKLRPFYIFFGLTYLSMNTVIFSVNYENELLMSGLLLSSYYYFLFYSFFIIVKDAGKDLELSSYILYPIPIGCVVYMLLSEVYFFSESQYVIYVIEIFVGLYLLHNITKDRKEIIHEEYKKENEKIFWRSYIVTLYYIIAIILYVLFRDVIITMICIAIGTILYANNLRRIT
jgi:hypothetical protein